MHPLITDRIERLTLKPELYFIKFWTIFQQLAALLVLLYQKKLCYWQGTWTKFMLIKNVAYLDNAGPMHGQTFKIKKRFELIAFSFSGIAAVCVRSRKLVKQITSHLFATLSSRGAFEAHWLTKILIGQWVFCSRQGLFKTNIAIGSAPR